MSRKKKAEPIEVPTHDSGLGAMLATAGKGEHGVLADWIEENLHLDDLAACLRASVDDPRKPSQRDRTSFLQFRYRQLDRYVLLIVAEFKVFDWSSGKKKTLPEGHCLTLCLSHEAPKGPTRLTRWLLQNTDCQGLTKLWTDLGQAAPAPLHD